MFRTTASAAIHVAFAASLAFVFTATFDAPQAAAKDPFGGEFDHYQCYRVADGGGLVGAQVKLRDQFREDSATVVRAEMLCNPVDKNGEGIPNEKVHLLCYSIKVDNPDDKAVYGVVIQNQLEESKYYVRGPDLLCVPSTKQLL